MIGALQEMFSTLQETFLASEVLIQKAENKRSCTLPSFFSARILDMANMAKTLAMFFVVNLQIYKFNNIK